MKLAFYQNLKAKLPPMPTAPPTHSPHRSTLLLLAALIFIATLLHFRIADTRIALYAITIFAVKAIIIIRELPAPPKIIMMILTIISLGLVLFIYGGWNGQTAGISFIVLLVSLKFLESDALRDYFVVCLLLYFLAASSFLFDSSILSILIIVFYTLGITCILLQISNPTKMPLKKTVMSSLGMVTKALPLAVLLFFFFPRVHGNFGFLPSQDQLGTDGLSDSLVAGDLATSAFNNELAFRVEFKDGLMPPRSELYWRAKTMVKEINFQWEIAPTARRGDPALEKINSAASLSKGDWFYEVLHEKSSDNFIPYLDYVSGASQGFILKDYSVVRRRKNINSFTYQGAASTRPSLNASVTQNLAPLLRTQSKPTARLQALLSSIRNKADTDREKIDQLYQHFINKPFNYSLTPPGLSDLNPLDDFMFNTRTGYCEHYASAFSTLARWLKIPARVVVGYQGGQLVNDGQYLEVRYSDAHAWSEVWVNGQWQRIDATATVSPERIEYGMDALRELWDSNQLGGGLSGQALASFLNPTRTTRMLLKMRDTWKSVGYQWNKWVVNYNTETQRELLETLGFKYKNGILSLVLIMFAGAISMMLLYFWQLIPRPVKRSDLQAAYLKFVNKFKRHGLTKNPSDTPEEFAIKARLLFPKHGDQISHISAKFQEMRYRDNQNSDNRKLIVFKQLVKEFRLDPKLKKT